MARSKKATGPKPGDLIFDGACLRVYLLPGCDASAKEWREEVDSSKLVAAFEAANALLTGPTRRIPADRAEILGKHESGRMYEWKGPKRGNQIYRALAYNPRGYDMYVAFAGEKKTQSLPRQWQDAARQRVTTAIERGDLT